MIMMSKLEKKLSNHVGILQNAIVLGQGFDHLSGILEIFKTVFVFSEAVQTVKARNIVYRTDLTNTHLLSEISVIFVDRDQVKNLENFYILWNSNKPMLCIEGAEEISKEQSAPIRSAKYIMAESHKRFHIWKRA
jgi:hypothetical protein